MKNAFFVSHCGLGDNITNIGAIIFLLQYYDTIYFLCKDIYAENVKLLFINKPVTIIPFNSKNEMNHLKQIILPINKENYDILISGSCIKSYLKSHITHPELLKYQRNNSKYIIKYNHIIEFYNDIGLDTSIYVDYFNIESSIISKTYYDGINNYKIIFLHTLGSNRKINVTNDINRFKNRDEYIMICANENVYNTNNSKYTVAEKYVNLKIAYYIDIIKNAEIIHVIDSCFSCIVYPLLLSKKISPLKCIITQGIPFN
jgi:hypothetical protein